MIWKRQASALCALAIAGCSHGTENNTLSQSEIDAGWTLLFDGRSMSEWRTYGSEDLADGWRIDGDTFVLVEAGAGDIVTRAMYENFELQLDWRIAEGGNSGIFILAAEADEPIYFSAPEIQILDDERHSDREIDSHRSGSLYDMVASHPSSRKPAGEWNTVRIRLDDGLLAVWQNGVPTATVVIGSSTWDTLLENSKFAEWERFAASPRGHIGLQDHGDKVWFRNLKIRVID